MQNTFPMIFSAGSFDSKTKFQGTGLTNPRTVNYYEIELFDKSGAVLYLNDIIYHPERGSILIACPGDIRRCQLHFSCHFVHFDTKDTATEQLIRSLPSFMNFFNYKKFEPFFSSIQQKLISTDKYAGIFGSADLIQLLQTIKNETDAKNGRGSFVHSGDSTVSLALEYINTHYAEPIGVPQIADHCNVSVSYLHKLFVKFVEDTPNGRLTKIRIEAAKSMLLTCNVTLLEISEACGFASQSYFCYCFKQYVGISPNKFRIRSIYPGI